MMFFLNEQIRSRAGIYKNGLLLGMFNGFFLTIISSLKDLAFLEPQAWQTYVPFLLGLVSGLG